MGMKQILNLLLLLGFTLLQGIAPLAHAHTGGSMVAHGLHLPGMQLHQGHAQHEYCSVDEAEESEFVLASQGVHREDGFDNHDKPSGMPYSLPLVVASAPTLLSYPPTALLATSLSSRLLPFPNAPPRI